VQIISKALHAKSLKQYFRQDDNTSLRPQRFFKIETPTSELRRVSRRPLELSIIVVNNPQHWWMQQLSIKVLIIFVIPSIISVTTFPISPSPKQGSCNSSHLFLKNINPFYIFPT
jgi:hypothetical protein